MAQQVGWMKVITLAAGPNNDIAVDVTAKSTGTINLIGHASGSTITGFATDSFGEGAAYTVRNHGTVPITVGNDNVGSANGQRILTMTGGDYVLLPGRSIRIVYSTGGDTAMPTAWIALLPNGLDAPTFTTPPARTPGQAFQISTSRPAWGSYPCQIQVASTVLLGSGGTWTLLCDTTNPPTTVRDRFDLRLSGVLATERKVRSLQTYAPAGAWIMLVSTVDVGLIAPAFATLTSGQTEVTF